MLHLGHGLVEGLGELLRGLLHLRRGHLLHLGLRELSWRLHGRGHQGPVGGGLLGKAVRRHLGVSSVEPLAHGIILLFGVHLHQGVVDLLDGRLIHDFLFRILTAFLISLTDLLHVAEVVLHDLNVHQILLLLLFRLLVGLLLLFDLILMVRHLDVIDEFLAFLDDLLTLRLLESDFYLLFPLLLLVFAARLLHLFAQGLGQGAKNRI